ncbi:MAG: hypothetical protein IJB97_08335 [Clostridia bacterium]|nr:hypothetical protein [Clostridia bacterium]
MAETQQEQQQLQNAQNGEATTAGVSAAEASAAQTPVAGNVAGGATEATETEATTATTATTEAAATTEAGDTEVGDVEELSKGKKAWGIIKTVIYWTIVAASVFMMAFTLISSKTFNKPNADIFGYKMFIVLSDSMKATDFKAGDLVIVKQVDPTSLEEGDIITFYDPTDPSYKKTVSHKIHSLTVDDNGDPGFKTYGTTTGEIDGWVVTYPLILGEYITHIPNAGHFFNLLKNPQTYGLPSWFGYAVFILLPFMILIVWQAVSMIRTYKSYKEEQTAEQTAELAAEREQVAKEREETQRMMDELNALKAMLMQQNQGGGGATNGANTQPQPPQTSAQDGQPLSGGAPQNGNGENGGN